MAEVTLTIDGQQVKVPKGTTILQAARLVGREIPTLCYLEGINAIGSCRVCLVEVKGAKTLMPACVTEATEGMTVLTNSPAARNARRLNLELILSDHPDECTTCPRNQSCELQALAEKMNIREVRFRGPRPSYAIDASSPSIVRDPNKCILCRRCVAVCEKVQGVGAVVPLERGYRTTIGPAFHEPLLEAACVLCGQCVVACPVGALYERDHTEEVWEALADPKRHVVVQTAPAVRVAIGEEFGLPPGAVTTGKLVAALRRLGFDRVFDTNFTADLTIIEEGSELLQRLQNGGPLPMFTSCSPGWIKYMEHFYPELIEHISTCKSPQQMFGALAKTYYPQQAGIDPAAVTVVSIMPCTAKKYEAQRPEMNSSGFQDVDYVLTTRELARMIKTAGLEFESLPEEEYDDPLGISTGAGAIFGATGGVMEAAIRTVYEIVTKEELPGLDLLPVRGLEGVKEATVTVGDTTLKVAVAHGLANARKVVERVLNKEADYHFIEIMCCPGGCIGGGGQPITRMDDAKEKRMEGIYQVDRDLPIRKSHENPAVQKLYEDFLKEPLGHKSHELLHTTYRARSRFGSVMEHV